MGWGGVLVVNIMELKLGMVIAIVMFMGTEMGNGQWAMGNGNRMVLFCIHGQSLGNPSPAVCVKSVGRV